MAGYSRFRVRTRKIIVFFLLSLSAGKSSSTCPGLCECGHQSGYKYVVCNNANFTTLPNDIPVDAVSLFLSNTKLSSLSANDFSRLPNLAKIELTNNQIENITDGIFNGLTNLRTLNLLNNKIRRISSNAFAGLTSLTKLTLSNNELKSLPKDLLKDLTNLQTLNLDNNLLNALPSGFLNGTVKLISLFLNKNQLERIDDKAFVTAGSNLLIVKLENNRLSSFPRAINDLKRAIILRIHNNIMKTIPQEAEPFFEQVKNSHGEISLSGNPFMCTWSLQWLQSWMNQNKGVIKDIDQVMCTTLDGKTTKLSEYNFNSTVSPFSLVPSTTMTSTTIKTTEILPSTTHAPPLTTLNQQTTMPTSSPDITTTKIFSDSLTSASEVTLAAEALTRTSTDVVTRVSENVTRTQEMLVSTTAVVTVLSGSTSVPELITSVLPSLLTSSSSSSSSASPSLSPSPSSLPSPSSPSSSSTSSLTSTSSSALPSSSPSPSPSSSQTSSLPSSPSFTITPSPLSHLTSSPIQRSLTISATPSASSNITRNIFINPTRKKDEADTSPLNRNKHIILATCLSAVFIGLVVFVAMYCFRNKIIKREKAQRSRYDRVRIV